jgi:hypothetical protein
MCCGAVLIKDLNLQKFLFDTNNLDFIKEQQSGKKL